LNSAACPGSPLKLIARIKLAELRHRLKRRKVLHRRANCSIGIKLSKAQNRDAGAFPRSFFMLEFGKPR
jgi:hypothetical protein